MASGPIHTLMNALRKAVGRAAEDDSSDAGLLERFAAHRDEVAFEVLVQRFGPMVFGVCQRVLRDAHAAEDAFQATFLVLAKKARSVARRELVGNWLWGVAYRTAKRAKADAAKADAARWRVREGQIRMPPASDPLEDVIWRDLRSVLDEEIGRLPAKYRRPVLLCYLEGKTNEQAARQLSCPLGTVFTRLARARELLHGRLTRRGLTLSAAAFAAALAGEATAGIPLILVGSTVKAASLFASGNPAAAAIVSVRAATLAQGALKAMFLNKLKITAVLLFGVVTLVSAGILYGYQASGDHALGGVRPDRDNDRVVAIGNEQTIPDQVGAEAKPSTPASDNPDAGPEGDPLAGQGNGFGAGFGQRGGFGQGAGFGQGGGFGGGFGQGGGFGFGFGFGTGSGNGSDKLSSLLEKDVQKELALTATQLKRIRELHSKQQKALKALVPQNPLQAFKDPAATMKDMQAAAAKMTELTKEIDKAIDEALSEKQGSRLRELLLQRQRGHALHDPKVAEALSLTKEQQNQLQEIEAAGMKKMQQLGFETMGNVFKAGPNPAAFQKAQNVGKQMREIWDQTGDELLDILTTEQKSKWKELTGKPFKGKQVR